MKPKTKAAKTARKTAKPRQRPKLLWFARAGAIARKGPYATQQAATESVRLVKPRDDDERAWREWQATRDGRLSITGDFYDNTFIWPEG